MYKLYTSMNQSMTKIGSYTHVIIHIHIHVTTCTGK